MTDSTENEGPIAAAIANLNLTLGTLEQQAQRQIELLEALHEEAVYWRQKHEATQASWLASLSHKLGT